MGIGEHPPLSLTTASPRGEIFNELPDRLSDILIFIGVAHSGWCHPLMGYWAAIASDETFFCAAPRRVFAWCASRTGRCASSTCSRPTA